MKAADFARKNPSGLLPKILLTLAEIEGRRNNGQLAYQLMLEAYQANEKTKTTNTIRTVCPDLRLNWT